MAEGTTGGTDPLSLVTGPGTGYAEGWTAAQRPQFGALGDATGDGVPDMWSVVNETSGTFWFHPTEGKALGATPPSRSVPAAGRVPSSRSPDPPLGPPRPTGPHLPLHAGVRPFAVPGRAGPGGAPPRRGGGVPGPWCAGWRSGR
ncbi:hypothetical protein [Streptomyces sp. NPDC097619]|uniref:hypothetical protein n=1 Tax=Streptomyces sp. NPDC097619 TaxID=3157228 RepID=UPI003320ED16